MEQLNNMLPESQEAMKIAVGDTAKETRESRLLDKVRSNFSFYGSICLIFGGAFTLLFYDVGVGLNVLLFSVLITILLNAILHKLSLKVKAGTKMYYAGVLLLGLSTCLTSSGILQFLNIIGILMLLDLSLLHQFYDIRKWDFAKHVGKMFGMIGYSIASMWMPFADSINYVKKTRFLKNDRFRNVILGIIIAIPMLFLVVALLADADMIFGEIARNVFQVFFSSDIIVIAIMLIFGFFASYCILCGSLFSEGQPEKKGMAKADPTIAITFMLALCLVYAFFCGIQLIYLFTNGSFALPSGFTFAEYARKGFFELLAVTIINIVIMIFCGSFFRESKVLRLLVAGMTVCTYVMIASATYRMILYIDAYHLTFLRLFVLLALLIDAFVLAGIIILQFKKDFPLFGYCVAVVSVCYIVFSLAKPDYYIASYLTEKKEVLSMEDMHYLTQELSLDGAPVILPMIHEEGRWSKFESDYSNDEYLTYESDYYRRIANVSDSKDLRGFDYSYYKASQLAKEYPKKQ